MYCCNDLLCVSGLYCCYYYVHFSVVITDNVCIVVCIVVIIMCIVVIIMHVIVAVIIMCIDFIIMLVRSEWIGARIVRVVVIHMISMCIAVSIMCIAAIILCIVACYVACCSYSYGCYYYVSF